MKSDKASVLDALRAARLVSEALENESLESFRNNWITQSAVLHQLMVLGEATKRLSLDLKKQFPAVPWKRVAGLRDVLIHQYDHVELNEVYRIVKDEIPLLISTLKTIDDSLDFPPHPPRTR